MRRTLRVVVLGCASAFIVAVADAQQQVQPQVQQEGWGLNRLGAHLGLGWVTRASTAFEVGAHADIGWLVDRQARVVVGINHLAADVDRTVDGEAVAGSFRDVTVTGDVQLKLFRVGQVTPYVGAGVGLHFLGERDIPDQNIRDIYDGLVVGLHYFGGVSWDISPDRRWAATGELRGVAAQNVGRTSLRAGITYRFGPLVIP